MKDKVRLRIRMLPLGECQEAWVPLCFTVGQASDLLVRLLQTTAHTFVRGDYPARLMLLEGESAGLLLEEKASMQSLVNHGMLCDGYELALL